MAKESFIMYKSFYKPVSRFSNEQLGRLFRAIFKYQLSDDNIQADIDVDIATAYDFFINQFKIDEEKYNTTCKRMSENAKIRWNKEVCKSMQKYANDADNDNKETTTNVVVKKDELSLNLLKRRAEFTETLRPFVKVYGKDMMNEFFSYWSEPNKSGTKMRFEMEKTWDIKRRLSRWANNRFNTKQYETGHRDSGQRLDDAAKLIAELAAEEKK